MAVNFRRFAIQVLWKLDPLVRVPLVVAIESLLALTFVSSESKNVYPAVQVLPGKTKENSI